MIDNNFILHMKQINKKQPIRKRNHLMPQNTIFYFVNNNQGNSFIHNSLKGSKIKAKNQESIHDMKTRYGERADAWKITKMQNTQNLIYQQSKQDETLKNYEKQRMSLESFRPKRFSELVSQARRTIKNGSPNLLISSQSTQIPSSKQREIPYFRSKNLPSKTNEYLNILIKNSQEEQQLKLQKMLQEQDQRKQDIKICNTFMRKMKISLNKSKSKAKTFRKNSPNMQYSQNQFRNFSFSKMQIQSSDSLQAENLRTTKQNSQSFENPKRQIKFIGFNSRPRNRYANEGDLQRQRNPAIKQLMDKVKRWEEDDKQL